MHFFFGYYVRDMPLFRCSNYIYFSLEVQYVKNVHLLNLYSPKKGSIIPD